MKESTSVTGSPIWVVSGLPRSGTSLMMQMLDAGGLDILSDQKRKSDINNPRGYFEFELVKTLPRDTSWIDQARGKALKVVLQLLPYLPSHVPLKILIMKRPLDEVVDSQAKMLRAARKQPAVDQQALMATYRKQADVILRQLAARPNTALLEVDFHRLIFGDQELLNAIVDFVGQPDLNMSAMKAVVDRELYRTKTVQEIDVITPWNKLPWQTSKVKGLIVISVPKSGTNFLTRYLSSITGWSHQWGRPSRDHSNLDSEIPPEPDPDVMRCASHLIYTDNDIVNLPAEQRPALFGYRRLLSLDELNNPSNDYFESSQSAKSLVVIAEHPVKSLAFFLRNPGQVPILTPAEVTHEAEELGHGVLFLYRDLKDIANSLAHFLYAGTRFVKFKSLENSFDIVVYRYVPVLAKAIRMWKQDFHGMHITYEELTRETKKICQRIVNDFELPLSPAKLIESTDQFKTFTFRKGGTGDWRNHLSQSHSQYLNEHYPDLVSLD